MTPRSRRCIAKHTEYMSIFPREKACLSVSRRRPCPSERGDLLESERDDLLDQLVRSWTLETHWLELCWTDRKSKFSPNVRRKLRNTNSSLIMIEEGVRKLGEIIESQQEELHCAQVEEFQRRDQQLLPERLLQQNFDLRAKKWKNWSDFKAPPSTLLREED